MASSIHHMDLKLHLSSIFIVNCNFDADKFSKQLLQMLNADSGIVNKLIILDDVYFYLSDMGYNHHKMMVRCFSCRLVLSGRIYAVYNQRTAVMARNSENAKTAWEEGWCSYINKQSSCPVFWTNKF